MFKWCRNWRWNMSFLKKNSLFPSTKQTTLIWEKLNNLMSWKSLFDEIPLDFSIFLIGFHEFMHLIEKKIQKRKYNFFYYTERGYFLSYWWNFQSKFNKFLIRIQIFRVLSPSFVSSMYQTTRELTPNSPTSCSFLNTDQSEEEFVWWIFLDRLV